MIKNIETKFKKGDNVYVVNGGLSIIKTKIIKTPKNANDYNYWVLVDQLNTFSIETTSYMFFDEKNIFLSMDDAIEHLR